MVQRCGQGAEGVLQDFFLKLHDSHVVKFLEKETPQYFLLFLLYKTKK